MQETPLDRAARTVASRYAVVGPRANIVSLGNRGGFSGARLWSVRTETDAFSLKAWPPGDPSPDRLRWIHHLMRLARNQGLLFVPAVSETRDRSTSVHHASRLWELTTWMPGAADFHADPTAEKLRAACAAVAHLHRVWARVDPLAGPCPAVQRRYKRAREWLEWIKGGWQPRLDQSPAPELPPWTGRAWTLLPAGVHYVLRVLQPWIDRSLPLQPCLCDVWHDHVLFEGDRVTGLIDYGAVKVDHVAVDVARMLGSLIEDDDEGWQCGLAAYRSVRAFSDEEARLARVLDVTGTVLGVANWLQRIGEMRTEEQQEAVARRLDTLVQRLERWDKRTPLAAFH
jgi:Ser/Thr protein kinase RdoA (MazF antagonist)